MGMNNSEDPNIQFEHTKTVDQKLSIPIFPKILILGVGGAGNNCINELSSKNILGVKTIAINTDSQQLYATSADCKILIGTELTRGMGVGGDPSLGMECAKASSSTLEKLFDDVELIFLIAGMGGGTGTGASSIIADLARSKNVIVIAIVTTPFHFECGRSRKAKYGLRRLSSTAHSLLIVDNNRLLNLAPDLPIDHAFKQIDNLIADVVSGLTETMTKPSLINLDFADIKTIMKKGNLALMYYGESETLDPNEIVKNTLNNPLLNLDHRKANGALIHITGGSELSLQLTTEITRNITKELKPKANVIMGARINPDFKKEVRLLTIMTGIQPSADFGTFNDIGSSHNIGMTSTN